MWSSFGWHLGNNVRDYLAFLTYRDGMGWGGVGCGGSRGLDRGRSGGGGGFVGGWVWFGHVIGVVTGGLGWVYLGWFRAGRAWEARMEKKIQTSKGKEVAAHIFFGVLSVA